MSCCCLRHSGMVRRDQTRNLEVYMMSHGTARVVVDGRERRHINRIGLNRLLGLTAMGIVAAGRFLG